MSCVGTMESAAFNAADCAGFITACVGAGLCAADCCGGNDELAPCAKLVFANVLPKFGAAKFGALMKGEPPPPPPSCSPCPPPDCDAMLKPPLPSVPEEVSVRVGLYCSVSELDSCGA